MKRRIKRIAKGFVRYSIVPAFLMGIPAPLTAVISPDPLPIITTDTVIAQAEQIEHQPLSFTEWKSAIQSIQQSNADDWTKALQILAYTRAVAKTEAFTGPGINETHDMERLYTEMANGHTVLCNDLATLLEYAYSVAHIPAVRFYLTGVNPKDTHVTVDVWLADRQQWANVGPTFGGYWTTSNNLVTLSTPEIHRRVLSGKMETVQFHALGSWISPRPESYVTSVPGLYHRIQRQNPILPMPVADN
jgi:hypothetical protein